MQEVSAQEELVDEMFSTFYLNKETWERIKELVKQGENNGELSTLLNEHYEERTDGRESLFIKGSNGL